MLKTQGTTIYGNRYRVTSPMPARSFNGEFIVRVRFTLTGHEQVITIEEFETGDFTDNSIDTHVCPEPSTELEAVKTAVTDEVDIATVEVATKEIKVEAEEIKIEEKPKAKGKPTTKNKDKK